MSPVRNSSSPSHGQPELARELRGRRVPGGDHQLVPLEVRDPPEVDIRAAVLGGADRARNVLGQQVVDRDAVLVAVHVDPPVPSTSSAEHEPRRRRR